MSRIRAEDISNITSESGVIASLIYHPEYSFFSENLLPNHFTEPSNKYIYLAICNLAKQGIKTVDPYNILESLNSQENTRRYADELSVRQLSEFIDISESIARHSVEEYMMLVNSVMDAAFRRDTFRRLQECQALCYNQSATDIEQKIYSTLDDVMMEFSMTSEVQPYRDVVDEYWEQIIDRQGMGYAGIPFKFEALNQYATIERGELFIFAAEAKTGKSMMLLNCAVDLLKRDLAVLYLDSELNTRLFTARLLSHLSGVEFKRLTAGAYSKEEEEKILGAKEWLKTKKFTHIYMPVFDQESIYTTVKKVKHTEGIDVLIVDYFKGGDQTEDAWGAYAELGKLTNLIKNRICGDMNIAGIGAAQATSAGRIADSAKISRNASTIAFIRDKTIDEMEMDGIECGNKKLIVALNRNGMQMAPGEYIDLQFDGNRVSYEQAKQHIPQTPF